MSKRKVHPDYSIIVPWILKGGDIEPTWFEFEKIRVCLAMLSFYGKKHIEIWNIEVIDDNDKSKGIFTGFFNWLLLICNALDVKQVSIRMIQEPRLRDFCKKRGMNEHATNYKNFPSYKLEL